MLKLKENKTTKITIDILDEDNKDISNLLELALSNLGYSRKQIVNYSLLVEEALIKWRDRVQHGRDLVFTRKEDSKKIQFTFELAGSECDPFNLDFGNDEDYIETKMQRANDLMLSGVGSELSYKYKKDTNRLQLVLPKADIEKKLFRHRLIVLMIPLVVQSLLDNISTCVDTIMMGLVDTTAMSSLSLALNFRNIHSYGMLAVLCAGTIMLAQFWGKRDRKSCWDVLKIMTVASLLFSLILFVASFFFPTSIMQFYTDKPILIESGSIYLRTISWSYLMIAIYRVYFTFMRVINEVRKIMIYSFIGCISNILFNAVLIYGFFGIKPMGVRGVAISTVICSIISLLLVMGYHFRKGKSFVKKGKFNRINSALLKQFLSEASFVSIQVAVLLLGANVIASAFGHMNEDIVAANALVVTIHTMVNIIKDGVGSASGILVGARLGRNELDLAQKASKEAYKVAFTIAVIFAISMFILGLIMQSGVISLSDQACYYLRILLLACCINSIPGLLNAVSVYGCLYAGGDTRAALVIDTIIMFAVMIPISLISIYTDFLPTIFTICILRLDELVLFPVRLYRVHMKKWLKNVTG